MMDLEAVEPQPTATFRPGDVVLLRLKFEMASAAMARTQDMLRQTSEETGVKFVLLSPDVEVVVPVEQNGG